MSDGWNAAPRRRVVLWRHGRTAWNVENRFQGATDVPLDEVGRAQAAAAAPALARMGLTAIVSSDLERAATTARVLADLTGLDVVEDSGLRETDGGRWQGLTRNEIIEQDRDLFLAWVAGHDVRPPGGEVRSEVVSRVVGAVDRAGCGTARGRDARRRQPRRVDPRRDRRAAGPGPGTVDRPGRHQQLRVERAQPADAAGRARRRAGDQVAPRGVQRGYRPRARPGRRRRLRPGRSAFAAAEGIRRSPTGAAPPESPHAEFHNVKDPREHREASHIVELRGLEPLTPCMPCRCATSCATAPNTPEGYPRSAPDRKSVPALGIAPGMLFGRESALRRAPFAASDVARRHMEAARASTAGSRGRFRVHSRHSTHATGMHGREVRDTRHTAHGSSRRPGPVVAAVALEPSIARRSSIAARRWARRVLLLGAGESTGIRRVCAGHPAAPADSRAGAERLWAVIPARATEHSDYPCAP